MTSFLPPKLYFLNILSKILQILAFYSTITWKLPHQSRSRFHKSKILDLFYTLYLKRLTLGITPYYIGQSEFFHSLLTQRTFFNQFCAGGNLGEKVFFATFAARLTRWTPPIWEVSQCFSIHWHQVVSINANFLLEEIWVKKNFFDTFAACLTWPTPPFWEVSWCFSIHWYQIVSINANFLLEENWVKKSQMGFSFQGPGSQPPWLWCSWPKEML